MATTIIGILVFVAVMALTLLLFTGWVAMSLFRGAARLIFGVPRRAVAAGGALGSTVCPRQRCHATNRPGARFCRRCGVAFSEPSSMPRRMAI